MDEIIEIDDDTPILHPEDHKVSLANKWKIPERTTSPDDIPSIPVDKGLVRQEADENAEDSAAVQEKFQCNACSIQFAEEIELENHLGVHSLQAQESFRAQRLFREHAGKLPALPKCGICGQSFQNTILIEEHIRKDHATVQENNERDVSNMLERLNTREATPALITRPPNPPLPRQLLSTIDVNTLQPSHQPTLVPLEDSKEKLPSDAKRTCPVCSKELPNATFVKHFVTHLFGGNFQCESCGKVFTSAEAVKRHNREIHNIVCKPFACKYCSAKFTTELKMGRHLVEVHRGADDSVEIQEDIDFAEDQWDDTEDTVASIAANQNDSGFEGSTVVEQTNFIEISQEQSVQKVLTPEDTNGNGMKNTQEICVIIYPMSSPTGFALQPQDITINNHATTTIKEKDQQMVEIIPLEQLQTIRKQIQEQQILNKLPAANEEVIYEIQSSDSEHENLEDTSVKDISFESNETLSQEEANVEKPSGAWSVYGEIFKKPDVPNENVLTDCTNIDHPYSLLSAPRVAEEIVAQKMKSGYKLIGFPCKLCSQKLYAQIDLDNHMKYGHKAPYVVLTDIKHLKEFKDKENIGDNNLEHTVMKNKSVKAFTTSTKSLSKDGVNHKNLKTKKTKQKSVKRCIFNTSIQCKQCSELFATRYLLDKHLKANHNGLLVAVTANFPCKSCNMVFQYEDDLIDHKREHKTTATYHDSKPISCPICNKVFPKGRCCRTKEGNSNCSKCSRKLTIHMSWHKNKRIRKKRPCKYCDKIFSGPYMLFKHCKAEHTCKECNCMTFFNKDEMEAHVTLHHSDLATFKDPKMCALCDKVFPHPNDLQEHISKHFSNNLLAGEEGTKEITNPGVSS